MKESCKDAKIPFGPKPKTRYWLATKLIAQPDWLLTEMMMRASFATNKMNLPTIYQVSIYKETPTLDGFFDEEFQNISCSRCRKLFGIANDALLL